MAKLEEGEKMETEKLVSPWVPIDNNSDRLEVPRGWIVRSWVYGVGTTGGASVHHVFIADPNHIWVL